MAQLPTKERFRLNPHQLRHTSLKRVSDKHGVHVAQKMSGNVSIREIFRYAQSSEEEVDWVAGGLFVGSDCCATAAPHAASSCPWWIVWVGWLTWRT
jgi:hypothetical protein